mmetsp:Transcript_31757/g.95068  ORF Transcript_31757/g.95068 Transcript_31757/m.95068 type:complete len:134 (+) Transcript_31757:781-1182(+)
MERAAKKIVHPQESDNTAALEAWQTNSKRTQSHVKTDGLDVINLSLQSNRLCGPTPQLPLRPRGPGDCGGYVHHHAMMNWKCWANRLNSKAMGRLPNELRSSNFLGLHHKFITTSCLVVLISVSNKSARQMVT